MEQKSQISNLQFLLSVLGLILMDQITKVFLNSRDFFLGPITVAQVKNFGLPFGINADSKISLLVVIILGGLLGYYIIRNKKTFSRVEQLGLILVIGGAISNIIDRLILGFVRDYFDLSLGFVFNLADVFIVLGLLMIFLYSFNGPKINN